MKTIQELYNEIMASQELKAQFIEAAKAGKQEEFLKAHGCEATLEEVKAFLEAKQSEDAPCPLTIWRTPPAARATQKPLGKRLFLSLLLPLAA